MQPMKIFLLLGVYIRIVSIINLSFECQEGHSQGNGDSPLSIRTLLPASVGRRGYIIIIFQTLQQRLCVELGVGGGNFANGWTQRQGSAAYCNTRRKTSGHSHQSQSTANKGLQENPTDGVVLIEPR
jgi:hypothetical protein